MTTLMTSTGSRAPVARWRRGRWWVLGALVALVALVPVVRLAAGARAYSVDGPTDVFTSMLSEAAPSRSRSSPSSAGA